MFKSSSNEQCYVKFSFVPFFNTGFSSRFKRVKDNRLENWNVESIIYQTVKVEIYKSKLITKPLRLCLLRAIDLLMQQPDISATFNNITVVPTEYNDALNYPRSLRKALAYMNAMVSSSPRLSDISQEACCSERTLQRVFIRELNITPMRYLKHLRLSYVYRDLFSGTVDNSVTFIALKYGFNHLGQFSCDYKKLFGESPSDTLKRQKFK